VFAVRLACIKIKLNGWTMESDHLKSDEALTRSEVAVDLRR
jgi:hypothetical protein